MRPPTYYYIGNPFEGILAFEGEERDGEVTEVTQSVIPNPDDIPLLNPIKGNLGKRVFKTAKEAKPAFVRMLQTSLVTFDSKLDATPEGHPERPDLEMLIAQLRYLLQVAAKRSLPVREVATLRYRLLQSNKPKRRSNMLSTRAQYARKRGGQKTRWRVETENGRTYLTALDDVIVSASSDAEEAVGQLLNRKLARYERQGAKVTQIA